MNPDLAQTVVNRVFASRLAASARYIAPDDSVTPCRVLVHRRGRAATGALPTNFHGLQLGLAVSPLDIIVRGSEVAQPASGGQFTLLDAAGNPRPGQVYDVGQDPLPEDSLGFAWRCPTTSTEAPS